MQELAIRIGGMSCDHCVRALTKALGQVPGVEIQHIRVGEAVVRIDPKKTNPGTIHAVIRDEGFEPLS